MSRRNWDQFAAASGIVFVGLYVAAAVLVSIHAPSISDPNTKWVTWVQGHRRELKASAILVGLAIFAFLWFIGSLTDTLRRGGEDRLAAVATAAGGAAAGVAVIGVSFVGVLAYRVVIEAPALTKSLWEVQLVAFTAINFIGAALMYTTAAAAWRANLFPRWYAWLVSVGALAVLFAGGGLALKGFYSPNGAFEFITTVVFVVWTVLTSVLLMMKARESDAPAAAAPAA